LIFENQLNIKKGEPLGSPFVLSLRKSCIFAHEILKETN